MENIHWTCFVYYCKKTNKKPELLPLTKDIEKLRKFLLYELSKMLKFCQESTKDRGNCLNRGQVSYLQKLVLIRIITFNARRGGEAAKLTIEQWKNCSDWKRQEDVDSLEDPLEKLLATRFELIYSKGKRKKRIPTIFTPEVQDVIEILLESQRKINIPDNNVYLFPCTTRRSVRHVRGWEVVHEIAHKAFLKKPELMTSTKIRKHMTTVLQLLDMNATELEWVTEHLGHTADVHHIWYRQEVSTLELTKVAKLLVAKDKGISFKNKAMRSISREF